jgi:hypothetical protein
VPTIPTNSMERELRKLYLVWLAGVPRHEDDIADYLDRFQRDSAALIARLGGQTASLGALAGFPVPKTLELSPVAGVVYDQMKQAAISASITAGLNSRDAARQMMYAGLDKGYKRLERLARTETVSAYWKHSWDSIADLPLIVMVWGSEESKRTCDYCLSRNGLVIEDGNIRDHPNGRCTPIPTLRSQVKYKGTLQPDGSVFMDPRWGRPAAPKPIQDDKAPNLVPPKQSIGPSDSDKVRNAEIMYGTGSKQHKAAQAKWTTTNPAPKLSPKITPDEMSVGTRAAEAQRVAMEKKIFKGKGFNLAEGWTQDTYKARQSYTEGGGAEMNAMLRNPKAYADSPDYDQYFADLFTKQIDDLTALLEKTELTQDVVVARGVLVAKGFNPGTMKTGDMFADPTFLSTTTNLKEAADFAAGRGRVSGVEGWTFITRAPKGTKAVPGADYQNELIFKPGQMQRVVEVDSKARVIYTEMTP